MSEIDDLRAQLEVERGLRAAADAENERLTAQVEAYAGDLGQLYQERHGRGRGGLAAETAQLRAQVADEEAQKQAIGQLYRGATEETSRLNDQLVAYGGDLSRAYRAARKAKAAAASAANPSWWRKPAVMPLVSALSGLLVGGATYASVLAPTPVGPGDGSPTVSPSPSVVGAPAARGASGVVVGSNGEVGRLGGPTPDSAGRAATAAADLIASRPQDPTTEQVDDLGVRDPTSPLAQVVGGALVAGVPGGPPSAPRPGASATAVAVGAARVAATAVRTPAAGASIPAVAPGTGTAAPIMAPAGATISATPLGPEWVPTLTALSGTAVAIAAQATAGASTATALATPIAVALQTGTALAGAGTRVATTATAFAMPTTRPSAVARPIRLPGVDPPEEIDAKQLRRCAFELPVPALAAGQAYLIEMPQRRQADVVAMWSASGGDVGLLASPGGQARFVPLDAQAAPADGLDEPGPSAIATGAQPGFYRARLSRGSGIGRESRAVVFYDDKSTCKPEPVGFLEGDAAAVAPPSSGPADSTPSAPAIVLTPIAPAPTATAVPATRTPAPSPTAAAPTAVPVPLERPYVDCQPYVKGPFGYLELRPVVWRDKAHTVEGSLPMRATLTGPSSARVVTDTFTAAPGAAARRLDLDGLGHYELAAEADGADLDGNCKWGYDHSRYS